MRPYECSPPGTQLQYFAWRIPWTGEPDGLHTVHRVARVRHNLVTNLCLWDSPGRNTGVGRHALLQGTFPTWGRSPPLQPPASAGGFFITSITSPEKKDMHRGRNPNLSLTNYAKSNPKWITDLNVNHKTSLEKNIGEGFQDLEQRVLRRDAKSTRHKRES